MAAHNDRPSRADCPHAACPTPNGCGLIDLCMTLAEAADNPSSTCDCGIADMSPKDWIGVPVKAGEPLHARSCPRFDGADNASRSAGAS